jgi:ribose/xylose/arabinose/galactoside ABC-type transport system permease subunit
VSAATDRRADGLEAKNESWFSRFLGVQGLATFVVFFVIFVFLSISSSSFLTPENLIGLLRQVAMLMIASVGMTFLIIAGGIDLSIGSSSAVTGVLCALAVARLGLPVSVGILAGILCGGALGLVNGLMVTQVRLPPLLATLGMMVALRGGAFLITGGHTIYGVPNEYLWLGRGYIGFIPVPVLIMLVIFVVYLFIQRRTRFGLYMYAIGGDRVASRRAGINDRLYTILAYVNTGLLVGLSGVIASSRFGAALPNAGLNFEMDVITAVVIGGTSIFGGLGRLGGTLLGVLIIGMITNGMLLLDIHSYWQQVAKGLILIIAVGAETIKQKKED